MRAFEPPYYAVIFSSRRTEGDNGYAEMAARMEELAATMPGFLGIESARGADGFGITVSYWESEEAIANWKKHAEHLIAQRRGRGEYYSDYQVRVAKVERAYAMKRGQD
jgi:heme-degrading monooxygenase HmoA